MRKLPIDATVSRTYGFLLGDLGTIVRLAWAPSLLAALVSHGYGPTIIESAINLKANPGAALDQVPTQLVLAAIGFVTGVMVMVVLLQVVIAGDRKPGLYVYLWLGPAERRLVLVSLLLGLAAMAAIMTALLLLGVLLGIGGAVPALSSVVVLAAFAASLALVWVGLRLSLLPSMVVAEATLNVERAWSLTRGNAPRLAAVFAMTYLPFTLLTTIVFIMVLGADFPPLPDTAGKQGEALRQVMEAWRNDLYRGMLAHWTALGVLNFAGGIVGSALVAGAAGNAYNALIESAAEQNRPAGE